MIRYIFIIIAILSLSACNKHEFSFDVKQQIFYSCNGIPIRNLTIKNDSIKNDGFPLEGTVSIYWNGNAGDKILNEIDLSNIPNSYILKKGGFQTKNKNYKLKPYSSYTVEKFGGGRPSFYLKIWTDSSGKVFKTTHPKCGLKSLENDD